MYLDFFGMSGSPFPAVALSENYFGFQCSQQAFDSVTSTIQRQAGPSIIVGPSGTGKSILLDRLQQHFQASMLTVSLSSTRLCTRRSLLQSLLFELNLDYQAKDEGELRLGLTQFLRTSDQCQHGLLLLVDEAHTLPMHLLDELRVLTNVVRSGRNLLQLVLAGTSRIEENLSEPSMDSFNQRIACRAYLSGVGCEELGRYIQHQLNRCGLNQSCFTTEAVRSIYIATNGIPRLVNQLAEFALVCAAEKKTLTIDEDLIQWAWSTMQQIPIVTEPRTSTAGSATPGSVTQSKTTTAATESIIEFGELDDEMPCGSGQEVASTIDQPVFTQQPVVEQQSSMEASPMSKAQNIELKNELEPVASGSIEIDNDDSPAVITFAFEQDIQRPVTTQAATISAEIQAEIAAAKQSNTAAAELQLESACEVNDERLEDDRHSVLPIAADAKKVASADESDFRFAEKEQIASEDAIDSVVNSDKAIQRMQSTIDAVSHALNSLDDDWLTVEQVLAEAELDAAVRPLVSDPQKSFPALAGGRQKGRQVKALVDPAEVFGDHLFHESEALDDTQWGKFLSAATLDDNSQQEKISSLQQGLEDLELQVAAELQLQDDLESYESIANLDDLTDGEDDRRIIHRSSEESISIQHEPHADVNPPVARRKDLRALLTALRGY